jgi:FKBP-type peptidyl-prolyl cis-trans isomerase FkpA
MSFPRGLAIALIAWVLCGCQQTTHESSMQNGSTEVSAGNDGGHAAPAAGSPDAKPAGEDGAMPEGLEIQDVVVGTGAVAEKGKTVMVHYTGWLVDGKKFDSSLDRNQPYSFVLGTGAVIKGWDLGVAGMRVGGKRRLVIAPDLAYGARGRPPVIPPKATLTFEVDLLDVQ